VGNHLDGEREIVKDEIDALAAEIATAPFERNHTLLWYLAEKEH